MPHPPSEVFTHTLEGHSTHARETWAVYLHVSLRAQTSPEGQRGGDHANGVLLTPQPNGAHSSQSKGTNSHSHGEGGRRLDGVVGGSSGEAEDFMMDSAGA